MAWQELEGSVVRGQTGSPLKFSVFGYPVCLHQAKPTLAAILLRSVFTGLVQPLACSSCLPSPCHAFPMPCPAMVSSARNFLASTVNYFATAPVCPHRPCTSVCAGLGLQPALSPNPSQTWPSACSCKQQWLNGRTVSQQPPFVCAHNPPPRFCKPPTLR